MAAALALVVGSGLLVGCGSDGPSAQAEEHPSTTEPTTCAASAVSGDYLYEIHGEQQFAEGFVPVLEVGLMSFDGTGGGTRVNTTSSTGKESKTTFTYEPGADCTGTMATEGGATYRATFSPAGDEVTFFAAGGGDAQRSLDGAAERVGDNPATCDLATLVGTYQYRARGTFDGKPHVEHGFEVYDGEGGVTNAFRVAGTDERETLVGTYEVDEDCHAVVTYDSGVVLDQYVAPDGGEFYWIQTDGFEEPGLFGGHEHRVSESTDPTLTAAS